MTQLIVVQVNNVPHGPIISKIKAHIINDYKITFDLNETTIIIQKYDLLYIIFHVKKNALYNTQSLL